VPNASGDKALAACDRAIGSGKFSEKLLANLHLNRGVEREAKKDLDGALADYEEAIRIDATPTAPAFATRSRNTTLPFRTSTRPSSSIPTTSGPTWTAGMLTARKAT
jgi:tetratricopeptide (TPR) repeat protein